ncbi:hypothetical protein STVIR_6033 [Streptomyces viridochromogenes Tue57]|uniref:Uncharacterized protein n=1 Tax=Streptomyces viridochromogenes Tue57 TaxID=1160705 RepID=L8PCF5_STRVR|nr:hypothetical protein STVIR_6033 [Streptomyces viridochromogenes Tue57]
MAHGAGDLWCADYVGVLEETGTITTTVGIR